MGPGIRNKNVWVWPDAGAFHKTNPANTQVSKAASPCIAIEPRYNCARSSADF